MYTLGADDRMHFQRTIGRKGDEAGRFLEPWGVTFLRGLLVVSERFGERVQVLSLEGVPFQVLNFNVELCGVCADEHRVWVTDDDTHRVHALLHA